MRKGTGWIVIMLTVVSVGYAQTSDRNTPTQSEASTDQVKTLKEIYENTAPILNDEPREIVNLSLRDCIRRALVHNYDIRVGSFDPAISLADVVEAEAAFDSVLFGSAQFDLVDEANIDTGFYTETIVTDGGVKQERIPYEPFDQSHTYDYIVGLRKRLPTGTSIQLAEVLRRYNDLNDDDQLYRNPFYEYGLQLELRQPLLRDFGIDINRAAIVASQNNYKISQQQFQLQVIRTVAEVETNYWRLFTIRQQYNILNERVNRAQVNMERILQRQNYDSSSLIIVRTKSDLKRSQADLVSARNDFLQQQDILLESINDPDLPLDKPWEIMTTDNPRLNRYTIDRPKAMEIALNNRSEIIAQRLRLDIAHLAESVSENQLLPRLDIFYRHEITGAGDDYNSAWDQQWHNDTVNQTLGVSFEIPLGNRAAEAARLRTRRERQQEDLRLLSVREQVLADLNIAAHRLENSFTEIDARLQAVDADRDHYLNYLAMEETQRSDIMTPNFINLKLNADESLARSQIQAVQIIIEYNLAIMDIHRAQGTLLRYNNIKLSEYPKQP